MTAQLEARRVRFAADPATPGGVLRQLAADASILVRAALALNQAAAPELDRVLARDADARVRALLAGRIARLLPGLSGPDRCAAAAHVDAVLATLVEDESVRVRAAIAEAVQDMPDAPRALVLRLAQDPALAVSDPVVRLSPLLTDADLLALLATPPRPDLAVSVAARAGLSGTVADAIVAHADAPAIRTLLANPSAAIREATLDSLCRQAGAHPDWHAPLVRRPALSLQAVKALSAVVAAELLGALSSRAGLDPALAATLRARVAGPPDAPPAGADRDAALLASVRRLNAANGLTETALLDAARQGDHRRTAAILSVGSGASLEAVDRAAALRNAKVLVSLSWKAGFSMRAAGVVQAMLGQIGPAAMLVPGAGGAFPLSAEEMEWQIEMLQEAARA